MRDKKWSLEYYLARCEPVARDIARNRARGKLCSEMTPHRLVRGGVPCRISATKEYNGKPYCYLHYPPFARKRRVKALDTLLRRLECEWRLTKKQRAEMKRTLKPNTKENPNG